MARVVLIEERDSVAQALDASLRESGAVERCDLFGSNARDEADRDWWATADIDTVVYSPRLHTSNHLTPDLSEAESILLRLGEIQIKHFVLLSSALVYGASPHNQGLIPESRLPVSYCRSKLAAEWQALESLVTDRLGASAKITILRPALVLAKVSGDYIARMLQRRIAVVLPGHDPSLQFLSPEDLAAAVRSAVERSGGGIYNVAPDGVITLRGALRLAGARRLPLPRTLRRLVREKDELDLIRYSWTVSNKKIKRELGFAPTRSSSEALARFMVKSRGHGVESREIPAKFDDFGQDSRYIDAYGRTLFRFLFKYYWRVEHRGLSHIPTAGRAVLVGVHRGFMPWDAVMTLHLISQRLRRYPRFLIHPGLIKFPFFFNFHTKLGGLLACQDNADYVLKRDQLLAIYPEGIRGAFALFRDTYRLKRFRDDYVRMALRHQAPIIPFVTIGSGEIFPILARVDWRWWKRWTDWPFFPLTPTWPLLPVPLPSKWHTQFLDPIHVEKQYPPESADDPATVKAISAEVKTRLETAIEEMLSRRKSIWHGSVFDDERTG